MKKSTRLRGLCLVALLGTLFLRIPAAQADDADQQFQAEQPRQADEERQQAQFQRQHAEQQQWFPQEPEPSGPPSPDGPCSFGPQDRRPRIGLPQPPLSRRPPQAPPSSGGTTTHSEERPGRVWHHPAEDEEDTSPRTTFSPAGTRENRPGAAGPAVGRGWLAAGAVGGVVLVFVSLLPLLVRWRYGRAVEVPTAVPAVPGLELQGDTRRADVKQRCVTCGKGIRIRGGRPGKTFRCPGCGTVQRLEGHP